MPAKEKPKPPVEGMKLVPYGLPLMDEAWWGCVFWVANNDEFRGVFQKKTGMSLDALLHRRPMDILVDKSTGYERKVIAAFLDFVAENFWGVRGQQRPKDVPRSPDGI